ncbi:MAG: Wzz/FepE/Etk N-terminal domain-containing protein [Eubacteriales bacterium]|nr:Wzz/FepE/Etk N-terminal domain-containing protein [Eubacteriales bacterium]
MEKKQKPKYENDEIDLKALFFALWHRAWLIILCGVICAGAAGIWTKKMITPLYKSSSVLYVLSSSTSITSLADIQIGTQLTTDYTILVTSRPVIETVIENLELDRSYEEVVGALSLSNPSDSRVLYITATDADPEMAKALADEVALVAQKQMADIMKTDEPSIVEWGHVAENPSSPNTRKNIMMGALLGMAAVCCVIIVLFLLDNTVKSSEDIERYLGLTTLGMIPIEEGARKEKKKRFRR